MVEQMNVASCEYPTETDEFVKSGFTPIDSEIVIAKRVKESPFQMECKLVQMVHCGESNMSGNLAICEVVKFHISEDIFTDDKIDPFKLDLVARNGYEYYTRANGSALFVVQKPGNKKGMGFDNIPDFIKNSKILSANNLGKLALKENIPTMEHVDSFIKDYYLNDNTEMDFESYYIIKNYKMMLSSALKLLQENKLKSFEFIELSAKTAIDLGDVDFGWNALLIQRSI